MLDIAGSIIGFAQKHHGRRSVEWISLRSCQRTNRSVPLLRRFSMGMGTCFGSEITSLFVQIREKCRHSRILHPSWLILPVVTEKQVIRLLTVVR